MPTYINAGVYQPEINFIETEGYTPRVYIDSEIVQILNENEENVIVEFTYEELRGIMAIMAAEQEKQHIHIKAIARKN